MMTKRKRVSTRSAERGPRMDLDLSGLEAFIYHCPNTNAFNLWNAEGHSHWHSYNWKCVGGSKMGIEERLALAIVGPISQDGQKREARPSRSHTKKNGA